MSLDKKVFVLRERCHLDYFLRWIAENWERQSLAGKPISITASETKRSMEANALMWVILTAWSKQVEWPINGRMGLLTPDEWKDILTAAFLGEMGRVAPGLTGGMVLLGCRTRDFSGTTMREFITFLFSESDAREVNIDRPREREEYRGRPAA